MKKTLCRSNSNRFITGVCGGLAEYFDIDASIVRIATVILCCISGIGIAAYVVAAVVMPLSTDDSDIVDVDDID